MKFVRIANFLGVVADTEWAAIKVAETLVTTWSDVSNLPDDAPNIALVEVVLPRRATPI